MPRERLRTHAHRRLLATTLARDTHIIIPSSTQSSGSPSGAGYRGTSPSKRPPPYDPPTTLGTGLRYKGTSPMRKRPPPYDPPTSLGIQGYLAERPVPKVPGGS